MISTFVLLLCTVLSILHYISERFFMKEFIVPSLLAIALALPVVSRAADGDVLTGDTKLACEATLCLSSSDRPGECAPSLLTLLFHQC